MTEPLSAVGAITMFVEDRNRAKDFYERAFASPPVYEDDNSVVFQLENLVVTPREPRSEKARPRKLGKVGRNVIEQIERSRSNDLSRLIYALGIRHVGEKAAATLARHLRTMDRVLDASAEALQAVPEIGPVVAESVRQFSDEPRNRRVVERLAARRPHLAGSRR